MLSEASDDCVVVHASGGLIAVELMVVEMDGIILGVGNTGESESMHRKSTLPLFSVFRFLAKSSTPSHFFSVNACFLNEEIFWPWEQ